MQPKESKSKSHFWFSMIKSGIRIIAGVALLFQDFEFAGLSFMLAEVLGILEEL
jgi:hypothetical protein